MDIGFIGLGQMGFHMARRLVEAGHRVIVFDTRREAVDRLIALGAQAAGSPREMADQVETVMASLPTPDIVLAVATGADGVIEGKRVRRFVDLSTTGAVMAKRIFEALKAKNIVQIDCPVSGGVTGAAKGTLALMVSGPRAEVNAIEPLLPAIGKTFLISEQPGAGQTMKLCNNYLSAAAMTATSEAMVMGVKAGLDPRIMLDVINSGTGRNTATEDKFGRVVLPRAFNLGFTVGLMTKDLKLCLSEGKALGVPMDVAEAVTRLLQTACDENGPDKDLSTVVQPVERRAGVEVRTPGNARGVPRSQEVAPRSRTDARATTEEIMSEDVHEIYAIRYGHHDRKAAENFIGGDPHDVLQPLDFYVWAIVGPRGPIILDTGFDAAMGKKRQRETIKPVGDGLKAIGIDPADVETVIVSHMHYDHVGNYDLFPRARYHLQDCEMAYATGRCMCHMALRLPFEADDVVAMVRKVFEAASPSTTARTRSCPASPSTMSAATPRVCRACA